MRGKRTILVAASVAAVLSTPGAAAANGGAYLELDQAHYLPGERGTAVTYVTIPKRRESILDRGPYYLFALPGATSLDEGAPIPMGAVRLGTFSIAEEEHQYELTAAFTVPRLESDLYTLGVCNDPCTVAGFREALSGQISVVATQREAELLNQNSRLSNRIYQLRADVRHAQRKLRKAEADSEWDLANAAAQRDDLKTEIGRLEASLAAAEQRASEASRPTFEPWLAGGIVTLAVAAALVMLRRRRLLPAVGDLP